MADAVRGCGCRRTRAAVGRHVVADDGSVATPLGHDGLGGVIGGVDIDVGQVAQEHWAREEGMDRWTRGRSGGERGAGVRRAHHDVIT
jgi:hypothetical protein